MSAEATAREVLTWAMNPEGPIPQGPVRPARSLASPDRETRAALAELTRAAAARLGAGSPPFGAAMPVGSGTLLLAAAIGGSAYTRQAQAIIAAVPPLRLADADRPRAQNWTEAVARHAVVAPVLGYLGTVARTVAPAVRALMESLLLASPLSAVLLRPTRERLAAELTDTEFRDAVAMLGRPRGRDVLCQVLARRHPDGGVLTWRARLLGRLRTGHPDVVIETYLTARTSHGADWDEQVHAAGEHLNGTVEPGDPAFETVRYWAPLAAMMSRQDTARLVYAHPLLTGYERAVELVRRYQIWES